MGNGKSILKDVAYKTLNPCGLPLNSPVLASPNHLSVALGLS